MAKSRSHSAGAMPPAQEALANELKYVLDKFILKKKPSNDNDQNKLNNNPWYFYEPDEDDSNNAPTRTISTTAPFTSPLLNSSGSDRVSGLKHGAIKNTLSCVISDFENVDRSDLLNTDQTRKKKPPLPPPKPKKTRISASQPDLTQDPWIQSLEFILENPYNFPSALPKSPRRLISNSNVNITLPSTRTEKNPLVYNNNLSILAAKPAKSCILATSCKPRYGSLHCLSTTRTSPSSESNFSVPLTDHLKYSTSQSGLYYSTPISRINEHFVLSESTPSFAHLETKDEKCDSLYFTPIGSPSSDIEPWRDDSIWDINSVCFDESVENVNQSAMEVLKETIQDLEENNYSAIIDIPDNPQHGELDMHSKPSKCDDPLTNTTYAVSLPQVTSRPPPQLLPLPPPPPSSPPVSPHSSLSYTLPSPPLHSSPKHSTEKKNLLFEVASISPVTNSGCRSETLLSDIFHNNLLSSPECTLLLSNNDIRADNIAPVAPPRKPRNKQNNFQDEHSTPEFFRDTALPVFYDNRLHVPIRMNLLQHQSQPEVLATKTHLSTNHSSCSQEVADIIGNNLSKDLSSTINFKPIVFESESLESFTCGQNGLSRSSNNIFPCGFNQTLMLNDDKVTNILKLEELIKSINIESDLVDLNPSSTQDTGEPIPDKLLLNTDPMSIVHRSTKNTNKSICNNDIEISNGPSPYHTLHGSDPNVESDLGNIPTTEIISKFPNMLVNSQDENANQSTRLVKFIGNNVFGEYLDETIHNNENEQSYENLKFKTSTGKQLIMKDTLKQPASNKSLKYSATKSIPHGTNSSNLYQQPDNVEPNVLSELYDSFAEIPSIHFNFVPTMKLVRLDRRRKHSLSSQTLSKQPYAAKSRYLRSLSTTAIPIFFNSSAETTRPKEQPCRPIDIPVFDKSTSQNFEAKTCPPSLDTSFVPSAVHDAIRQSQIIPRCIARSVSFHDFQPRAYLAKHPSMENIIQQSIEKSPKSTRSDLNDISIDTFSTAGPSKSKFHSSLGSLRQNVCDVHNIPNKFEKFDTYNRNESDITEAMSFPEKNQNYHYNNYNVISSGEINNYDSSGLAHDLFGHTKTCVSELSIRKISDGCRMLSQVQADFGSTVSASDIRVSPLKRKISFEQSPHTELFHSMSIPNLSSQPSKSSLKKQSSAGFLVAQFENKISNAETTESTDLLTSNRHPANECFVPAERSVNQLKEMFMEKIQSSKLNRSHSVSSIGALPAVVNNDYLGSPAIKRSPSETFLQEKVSIITVIN